MAADIVKRLTKRTQASLDLPCKLSSSRDYFFISAQLAKGMVCIGSPWQQGLALAIIIGLLGQGKWAWISSAELKLNIAIAVDFRLLLRRESQPVLKIPSVLQLRLAVLTFDIGRNYIG